MRTCPTVASHPPVAPPPRPCPVCGRTTRGTTPVCYCCRTVSGQLGLPLVPLVALAEYRIGDRTHRRLRAYKDAAVAEVRDRSRSELVTELAARCADPVAGPATRLRPWVVVTTVPSSCRPGGAPAEGLVDGVPWLSRDHLRLLIRGGGDGGHLRAGRDVFDLAPGVDRAGLAGLAVLVFDDTTTTGAAVQSAAAALRLAGAHVVGALVMGRALAPATGVGGAVRSASCRP